MTDGTFEHKGIVGTFIHFGCGTAHFPWRPCPERRTCEFCQTVVCGRCEGCCCVEPEMTCTCTGARQR